MHWDTLTPDRQAALRVEEEALEVSSLDRGVRRFRDQNAAQSMSQWPACRTLIATATEVLTSAIGVEVGKVTEGRGMKGAKGWGPVFTYVSPDVLALSAIVSVLDSITMQPDGANVREVRSRIGERVMLETHFTVLKKEAPRLKAVMERRIKKWERRSIKRAMSRITSDLGQVWDTEKKMRVGDKLLDMVLQHTGLVSKKQRLIDGSWKAVIYMPPEMVEAIATMNEHLEVLSPMFKPMVIPPNRWGPEEKGGYVLLSRYHGFVKQGVAYPDDMPDDHSPMVYGGVNALQATPWQINRRVLDTMTTVWEAGGGIAGVPEDEDLTIPPRYEKDGDDKEWRTLAERCHRHNARLVGKRLSFLQITSLGKEYRDRVFYYPYQCDFRGRIYPIPQFLQPQGCDVARGLLVFADPKPLGDRGMWWLCVQYANCWGVDKVTFEERFKWTSYKLLDRMPLGQSPLEFKHLWADAEDPWQALATLLEIRAAVCSGNVKTYRCPLPVNVDGSNSGLQHFSAMLRDAEGAKLVNLTNSPKPHDIYGKIAVCVERLVCEDRAAIERPREELDFDPLLPGQWLKAGITRSLCKRPGMTYCYGVTLQGLQNALIKDGYVDWADKQYPAVKYIGKRIWSAICECITGATEVMDWLRQAAECGNKANVLLEWVTPSGFHVLHPYNEPCEKRVRCLGGASVRFRVYDPEAEVWASKQRTALPPNFVHSLDASHLIMTVAAGSVVGLTYWMMIHDSFGTHACDVDLLRDVLREQFVKLYEVDVLGDFHRQVMAQTGLDPGPPPERGDFNLEEVHDSEYIFS